MKPLSVQVINGVIEVLMYLYFFHKWSLYLRPFCTSILYWSNKYLSIRCISHVFLLTIVSFSKQCYKTKLVFKYYIGTGTFNSILILFYTSFVLLVKSIFQRELTTRFLFKNGIHNKIFPFRLMMLNWFLQDVEITDAKL